MIPEARYYKQAKYFKKLYITLIYHIVRDHNKSALMFSMVIFADQ